MVRNKIGIAALVTVAAGVTLAGCADHRTNDLNHPHHTTTNAPPPTSPKSSPTHVASPAVTNTSQDTAAMLTNADLASEGVQASADSAPMQPCVAQVIGTSTDPAKSAWRYPTGATVVQYVASITARPGASATCGTPISLPKNTGVDEQSAWCSTSCVAQIAAGHRITVIGVQASTEQKSAAAIRRIAPLAAARLTSR